MRTRLLVAVWKEKLTLKQSLAATKTLLELTRQEAWPFEVAVAPNPIAYAGVASAVAGTNIRLCAQNILWTADSGSYIGETTPAMLKEIGCNFVIVGHSERRIHFGESNEMIANRALAAINTGFKPILCVGETAVERQAGRSHEIILGQLKSFFQRVPSSIRETDFIIAYEPVWAISTWRNAAPLPTGKEVQVIHVQLREVIAELKNKDFAQKISLLYGGSVAPENAEDYMAQPDVDGGLVGGASKSPEQFYETLKAARLGFQKQP